MRGGTGYKPAEPPGQDPGLTVGEKRLQRESRK
jgi:hypothetical protein